MTTERRQQIFNAMNSIPIAAAVYGIPFAAITSAMSDQPFSFALFVTKAVIFGVPMALLLKWQLKRNGRPTTQDFQLQNYIKTATLPTDPKLRKLMPLYLDKVELQVQKSKKALPLLAIIGVLNLLIAASSKSVLVGMVSVFIFAMMGLAIVSSRKTNERIANLREQLKRK